MSIQRIPAVASLLFLVLPICLSATMATRRPVAATATLQVTNDDSQGVNVILLRSDGAQFVLGEVDRDKSSVFVIPAELIGTPGTRVLADPIDHFTGFDSAPVTFETGGRASLIVEPAAAHSLLTLR